MREALMQAAPPTRALSAGPPAARRWRSQSPGGAAQNYGSECGGNESTISWGGGTPRLREGSVDRVNSLTRSTTEPRTYQSSYDPRARPRYDASQSSNSTARGVPRSASQDHLWRELFHDEVGDKKIARLRGAGQAIGNRGKSSVGVPWRQIPSYNQTGLMSETGDMYGGPEKEKHAVPLQYRKKGHCSMRLGSSEGMKDVLTDPPTEVESARDQWLNVIKRRYEAKHERKLPDKSDSSKLHWSYRPAKKVSGDFSTKDTCPYFREDAIPETQCYQPRKVDWRLKAATNKRTPPVTPVGSIAGPGLVSGARDVNPTSSQCAAMRVAEARRDYAHRQEMSNVKQNSAPRNLGKAKPIGERSPTSSAPKPKPTRRP